MPLSLAEFEAQRDHLWCQHCNHAPLDLEHNQNNGGVRPVCPSCQSVTPLRGVQWLRKRNANDRKPVRPSGDPTTEEVWQANGNHCAHCGLSAAQVEFLGIGKSKQHVIPFKDAGEDGPLIPLCSWCQQDAASQMKRLQSLIGRLSAKMAMPPGIPNAEPDA